MSPAAQAGAIPRNPGLDPCQLSHTQGRTTPMTSPLLALLAPLALSGLQDAPGGDPRELLAKVDRVTPVVLIARLVRPAVVYIETETTRRVRGLWGVHDRVYAGSG